MHNQEWKEVIDPRVRNLFTMGSGGMDKDKNTIKKYKLISQLYRLLYGGGKRVIVRRVSDPC